MLKVLVADENLETNSNCCQYLAKDKELNVFGVFNGISVIDKYYETKSDVLVINSDFKDKKCTQIVNELSFTTKERKNCNIFLTLDNRINLIDINYMAKIYKLFYLPVDYKKIRESIYQYEIDTNIIYGPNDETLTKLFYKLNIYNNLSGAKYLKDAIKECYENPSMLSSLDDVYKIISIKEKTSCEAIRSAIRRALESMQNYKSSTIAKNTKIFMLFENEEIITPKNFIKIITTYYLQRKK